MLREFHATINSNLRSFSLRCSLSTDLSEWCTWWLLWIWQEALFGFKYFNSQSQDSQCDILPVPLGIVSRVNFPILVQKRFVEYRHFISRQSVISCSWRFVWWKVGSIEFFAFLSNTDVTLVMRQAHYIAPELDRKIDSWTENKKRQAHTRTRKLTKKTQNGNVQSITTCKKIQQKQWIRFPSGI
jgi:hypothetical protein